MVNYICQRCNYTTNRKSNFIYHLNRKNTCKPILADVSILTISKMYNIVISSEKYLRYTENTPKIEHEYTENTPKIEHEYTENTPKIEHEYTENTPKIEKKNKKENLENNFLICNFCNKKFKYTRSRWRHEKYNCKIKKELENENKKLKQEILELKNEKLNTTINNINKGTINKGIINNITINQFFDTNNENILNRLNNKKILKYLNSKSYDNLLSLLCKQIYFNDKFPEDKNIKCTNLQSKLCDVFVDDSFKKMQKKKAYEHLTDKMAFLIQDLGDENKEKINNKGHKNLNLTQETLDNPEQHYDTINLELYNNTKNMNI